jgi:hypothetical protein
VPWTQDNINQATHDGDRTLKIVFDDTTNLEARILPGDSLKLAYANPKIKDLEDPPNYPQSNGRAVPLEIDSAYKDFACNLTASSNPVDRDAVVAIPFKLRLIENAEISFAIFDLLGNLVKRAEITAGPDYPLIPVDDEGFIKIMDWDFRNEKGRLVQKGGYVGVMKATSLESSRKIEMFIKIVVR